MKSLRYFFSFLVAAVALQSGCDFPFSSRPTESQLEALQYKNLIAREFGLERGEIALTLDDGPGARSVELARWLAEENVPVTYFMIGENAVARPSAVKTIASLKNEHNKPAMIIANHTMTHENSSLLTNYSAEILKADKVLAPFVKTDFFFRPPYGNLLTETWLKQKSNESDAAFKARLVAARKSDRLRVDNINATGDLDKYIGPVLWNVGTSMENGYAADWECWTLPGTNTQRLSRCIDGYVRNVQAVEPDGAIILAHDIHSLTVDMLMGTGAANGRSLVRELKNLGYTFVALNKNPEAYAAYRNQPLRHQSYVSVLPIEKQNSYFLSVAANKASFIRVMLSDKVVYEGMVRDPTDERVSIDLAQLNVNGFLKIDAFSHDQKLVGSVTLPLRRK